MRTTARSSSRRGTTSLVALVTITTLTFIAASFIVRITNRSRDGGHSASWIEASQVAESAGAVALAEIRRVSPDSVTFPGNAWSGWTATRNGAASALPVSKGIPATMVLQKTVSLTHGGEENTTCTAVVSIDAPAALLDTNQNQWLRVRATGTASLPGTMRVSMSNVDRHLRRLAFLKDWSTGQAVAHPQVSRSVECVVRPLPAFGAALQTQGLMSSTSQQTLVDSYDSTDQNKSTSGLYDGGKAQQNGTVWTNNATFSLIGTVHGDVGTDGAAAPANLVVSGSVNTAHYQALAPISAPNWGGLYSLSLPMVMNTSVSTSTMGTFYHFASIPLALTLKASKDSHGNVIPSQVQVWVDGDITGSINVEKGVQATIFLGGNMTVNASDLSNPSDDAANLQIYGVQPANGQNRTITLTMDSDLYAAIYAPGHAFVASRDGDLFGSFTAKTLRLKGNNQVHYDESLAQRTAFVVDYQMASWIEDVH
jgi:hypothetical protein